MNNITERKQVILDEIKQLRVGKSEAVTLSEGLQKQLVEKNLEIEAFAPIIDLVSDMSDAAWKVLPSVMKSVFAKYRGAEK